MECTELYLIILDPCLSFSDRSAYSPAPEDLHFTHMVYLGVSCPLRTYPRIWLFTRIYKPGGLVVARCSTTRKHIKLNWVEFCHCMLTSLSNAQIPLASDFRPFFTIHDVDHGVLVNSRPPTMGLLLGVTNPFYAKACQHWPHILSLNKTA